MFNSKIMGVGVCAALALLAFWLGTQQSVIGAPMIGLLLGMLLCNLAEWPGAFLDGTRFCAKKVLNAAIVFAGATLNIRQIAGVGGPALPLLLWNLLLVYTVTFFVGKKLGVSWNTAALVGSGTGICGGTAIASVASVIKAKEEEIAFAMTSIFLFDLVGAFTYPYLAKALGLSSAQFGFLAGSSINDTSSVSAAEDTFNALMGTADNFALTVKLTRTTLVILIVLVFSWYMARRQPQEKGLKLGQRLKSALPLFLVLFLVAAGINSLGVFDWASRGIWGDAAVLGGYFKNIFKFLTTVALCGVGFKMKFRDIFTKGGRPIALGGIAWGAVFLSSLAYTLILA